MKLTEEQIWKCNQVVDAVHICLEHQNVVDFARSIEREIGFTMGVLTQIDNMTAGLTAQRQPHYDKTEMNCFVQNLYDQKMREGKRGHYETMFHVVHRAIEAAHGIGEKK